MHVVSLFQEFKRIYGFCPCCGEPFRLSDATLFTRAEPPRTVFDVLADERDKVEKAREELEDQEESLREKARKKGRRAVMERLRSFLPFFARQRLDVRDVKLLFNPVDYLAFRDLTLGKCSDVVLIDREPNSRARENLHTSIQRSIREGDVEWLTARISDDGHVTFK